MWQIFLRILRKKIKSRNKHFFLNHGRKNNKNDCKIQTHNSEKNK